MILKSEEFADIIKQSEKLTNDSIITFGIKPDEPNTGYGYISPGEQKLNGYKVLQFKEKPDKQTAELYLKNGFLWNGGIFMFNSALFAEEVKNHQINIYENFNSKTDIAEVFSGIGKGISIDYGIMEKTNKAVVVPVEIGWNDLGSFDSFYEVFAKDEKSNITDSENIVIDSENNLIYSEKGKLVATVGLEDTIVIDNKDALLICKKNSSQGVKEVVKILQDRGLKFIVKFCSPPRLLQRLCC
jgi:mannose-1-phosphate guanylyltransferase/mannose-6-phosphate isomerase